MLAEHLERVRQRIHQAAQRCGREASAVTLVGVTKTVPLEMIRAAVALGLTEIGENRVQEAQEKLPHLAGVRRHLIGHLQRNKAREAAELFDVIHSVDSARLAEELEKRTQGKQLEVFVQVNVSGEATKFGCKPDHVEPLVQAIRQLPHLRLRGLMTMPPFSENPEGARPYFRRLRELRDSCRASLQLSMGMSSDFEVAIEEGSDFVRIGTAIFGPRDEPAR